MAQVRGETSPRAPVFGVALAAPGAAWGMPSEGALQLGVQGARPSCDHPQGEGLRGLERCAERVHSFWNLSPPRAWRSGRPGQPQHSEPPRNVCPDLSNGASTEEVGRAAEGLESRETRSSVSRAWGPGWEATTLMGGWCLFSGVMAKWTWVQTERVSVRAVWGGTSPVGGAMR